MEAEKVLLIGHPGCGSKHLANEFTAFGFDVPHKSWGDNGSVNWTLAQNPPSGYQIIHYIRNPLYVIPSIMNRPNENYIQTVLQSTFGINLNDYNALDRAVTSFLLWNTIIEGCKPEFVHKVEDSIVPLLENLGWEITEPVMHKTIINTPSAVDWSALRPDLLHALNEWCKKYGYQKIIAVKPISRVQQSNLDVHSHALQHQRSLALMSKNQQIFGPRTRNNSHVTPVQRGHSESQPVLDGDRSNIQPRLVHNVVAQSQEGAEVTPRERIKRTGFSVRAK